MARIEADALSLDYARTVPAAALLGNGQPPQRTLVERTAGLLGRACPCWRQQLAPSRAATPLASLSCGAVDDSVLRSPRSLSTTTCRVERVPCDYLPPELDFRLLFASRQRATRCASR